MADGIASSLTPGPSGLGSPWTSLTRSARYCSRVQLTITRSFSPGSTLSMSVYPTTFMAYPYSKRRPS